MLGFTILIWKLLLQDGHFCLLFDLLFDPLDSVGLVGDHGELLVLVINGQVQRHIFNIQLIIYQFLYLHLIKFTQNTHDQMSKKINELFDVSKLSEASLRKYQVMLRLCRVTSRSKPTRNSSEKKLKTTSMANCKLTLSKTSTPSYTSNARKKDTERGLPGVHDYQVASMNEWLKWNML